MRSRRLRIDRRDQLLPWPADVTQSFQEVLLITLAFHQFHLRVPPNLTFVLLFRGRRKYIVSSRDACRDAPSRELSWALSFVLQAVDTPPHARLYNIVITKVSNNTHLFFNVYTKIKVLQQFLTSIILVKFFKYTTYNELHVFGIAVVQVAKPFW